jgi:tRNA pseudouridine38-40 synthase
MARYQAVVEYDGTDFRGFQRQAQGRTVQGEIEIALRQMGWSSKSILAAGRTDTGVHAGGQVIAFDLDWQHGAETLLRALNTRLPRDVAAKEIAECPPEFHPRYAARARRYRYTIYHQRGRGPLTDRFAWRVWPPFNGEALREASAVLLGQHDFAAFGTDPDNGPNTVRTVTEATWHNPQPGWWWFDIQAEAFLYRMVRSLVGALKRVGADEMTVAEFAEVLRSRNRAECPPVAPPHGLCLTAVIY